MILLSQLLFSFFSFFFWILQECYTYKSCHFNYNCYSVKFFQVPYLLHLTWHISALFSDLILILFWSLSNLLFVFHVQFFLYFYHCYHLFSFTMYKCFYIKLWEAEKKAALGLYTDLLDTEKRAVLITVKSKLTRYQFFCW